MRRPSPIQSCLKTWGENMDSVETIKLALQMGMDGILLFLLSQLWKEHQAQNLFIRQMLLDAAEDREALFRATGAARPSTLERRLKRAAAQHDDRSE